MRSSLILLMLVALGIGALGGCAASPKQASFPVAPGSYEAAFDAAKDQLRATGFELGRVDARAGVIETLPRSSAGIATFWMGVETTPSQAWEGFLNNQRRQVVVRFEPVVSQEPDEQGDEQPAERPDDLRQVAGRLEGRVRVDVERIARPGLRVQSASIRMTSKSRDPLLEEQGLSPWYSVSDGEDGWLAGRLADRIREALSDADSTSIGASDTMERP